jgi:hypothetical protein
LRDVCTPQIKNGSLEPAKILADDVHPNTAGHRLTARMIALQLEKAFSKKPGILKEVKEIPAPLYSDLLEKVTFTYASGIMVSENNGWNLKEHAETRHQHWRLHGKPIIDQVWNATTPGSELTFDYEGTFLALTFYQYKAGTNAGSVKVEIDGVIQDTLLAEGEQTWGGVHKSEITGRELPNGKHKVRIELMDNVQGSSEPVGIDIIAVAHGVRK